MNIFPPVLANYSIKGDEFRRVIIDPSLEFPIIWAILIFFFRDSTFDLTVAINATSNPNAVELIAQNRSYIQDEVIAWILQQVANNTIPPVDLFTMSQKCERDVGLILDAIQMI